MNYVLKCFNVNFSCKFRLHEYKSNLSDHRDRINLNNSK